MKHTVDYNSFDWANLFEYDESSPTSLVWKKDRRVAGNRPKRGTTARVNLHNTSYAVSRIIYCLNFGNIEIDKVIDHIDGDNSNNKIQNLRLVTQQVNARNKALASNNTSGVSGVYWRVKNGKTVAVAQFYNDIDGVKTTRDFPVAKYGLLPAFSMACAYRNKQLASSVVEYTARHGK